MKLLKVILMIPFSFCVGFGLILAFFVSIAFIAKLVEIWLGAEWPFQVLAVLFLMATTGAHPNRLRAIREKCDE